MPRFSVSICRSIYQYGIVSVEAETEDHAIEMVEQDMNDTWRNATVDVEKHSFRKISSEDIIMEKNNGI